MYYNAIGKTYLAKINKCSMINPIQLFLLSRMNYSSEETLQIELPWYPRNRTCQEFSVIEECDASPIKSLIIQQDKYDRYDYPYDHLVTIPETISRLAALETIKINACIRELPVELSKLNNLKLLDLSSCYHLSYIPEEILEMKELKIKFGDIISRASEILFIPVPLNGVTPEVFSKIKSAKEKKIEQLIIRQIPAPSLSDRQEGFEVPDGIKDFHELKMLSVTGSVSSLPSWIGNMSTLCSMTELKSSPNAVWVDAVILTHYPRLLGISLNLLRSI